MSRKRIPLPERKGKLVFLEEVSLKVKGAYFLMVKYQCDCGNTGEFRKSKNLPDSCGCEKKDKPDSKHVDSYAWNKIRGSHKAMVERCNNPKSTSYPYYGAKGISVDPYYRVFRNFYNDMRETWVDGLSIDRFPDKHGNYAPGNIRWATGLIQLENQDKTITMEIAREIRNSSLSTRELSKKYNIDGNQVTRIKRNERWKEENIEYSLSVLEKQNNIAILNERTS